MSASVSAPSKLLTDPHCPESNVSSGRIPRHNHPRSLVHNGEGEAATARPRPRGAVALSSATPAEGFLFCCTFFSARAANSEPDNIGSEERGPPAGNIGQVLACGAVPRRPPDGSRGLSLSVFHFHALRDLGRKTPPLALLPQPTECCREILAFSLYDLLRITSTSQLAQHHFLKLGAAPALLRRHEYAGVHPPHRNSAGDTTFLRGKKWNPDLSEPKQRRVLLSETA
jgi:hypothetical protein